LAATPKGLRPDSPTIRWIPDQHGALQSNAAVLDELEGILTANPHRYRGTLIGFGVSAEPVVRAGEALTIRAEVRDQQRIALLARIYDEGGREVATDMLRFRDSVYEGKVDPLPPGAYRVLVGGVGSTASLVAPVTITVLVWGEDS
jgi:hypothetical protein